MALAVVIVAKERGARDSTSIHRCLEQASLVVLTELAQWDLVSCRWPTGSQACGEFLCGSEARLSAPKLSWDGCSEETAPLRASNTRRCDRAQTSQPSFDIPTSRLSFDAALSDLPQSSHLSSPGPVMTQ